MKRIFASLAIIALLVTSVQADQLNLIDGSVIKGKIIELHNGKVKIKTDFAGDLTIDQAKVAALTTDEPMMATTVAGDASVTGKLAPADEGKTNIAGTVVNTADIKTVWLPGSPDPSLPKPPAGRKWAYEVAFDVTGKTGNTEKTTVGGSGKATLTGPIDKLALYLRGRYAKENGVKNEEEIVAGTDYEIRLGGSSHTAYARAEAEKDEFNNYDLYFTSAAGYGFYVVDTDDFKVRLRAGLSYVRKCYIDETMDDEDNIGMDFNYHHELKIKNFGKLVTDITYTPTFDEFRDDYRIYHESALDIPLTKSGLWSIRLGVSNEYNNRVAEGAERMDTTYFGRLVISWN